MNQDEVEKKKRHARMKKELEEIKASKPSDEFFIKIFKDNVPEFNPNVQEHLKDYDEILAHVLFGEFTFYTTDLVKDSDYIDKNKDLLERIFKMIEWLLTMKNAYLTNLVYASFFENINPLEPEYPKLKPFIQGKLSNKAAKNLENYWGMNKKSQNL